MIQSGQRQKLALLAALTILISGLGIWISGESAGGPSRGFPRDMAVDDITSHEDGSTITMSPQEFNATFRNVGDDNYEDLIAVNLTVYTNFAGIKGDIVFTEKADHTGPVLAPDETFFHAFSPWTPGEPGSYMVNVTIVVDDDYEGNNSMEIDLTVLSGGAYGVRLTVDTSYKALPKGTSTQDPGYRPYRFTIYNTGINNDTYQIDIRSNWVMGDPPTSTGNLTSGQRVFIYVDVEVPPTASFTESDILMFNVTSVSDPDVWSQLNATTYVQSESGVGIEVFPKSQAAYPGGPWVDFTFRITNTGNRNERYFLTYIPSPTNWEVDYNVDVTPPLRQNESITVVASLRIPPLIFDTMEEDNTRRGDFGGLVLQAEGEYYATGSAEGKVLVGLVHTVDINLESNNKSVPWHPREEGSKKVNFTYRVRSVNNDFGEPSKSMKVSFDLPLGSDGVDFVPEWSDQENETESLRWMAGTVNNLSLRGGEWSPKLNLVVSYPSFPINGVGYVLLRANPLLNDTDAGFNASSSRYVTVFVEPMLDAELEPPQPPELTGDPGARVEINFTLTNTGNARDQYRTDASARPGPNATTLPNDWDIEYPNGSKTRAILPYYFDPVNGFHTTVITLIVAIPPAVPIGETVNITLRIVSLKSDLLERRAQVRITVKQGFGVDLEPEESFKTGAPNEKVPYRLNVTNTGNGFDVITFSNTVPDLENWKVEFETTDLDMDPGSQRTVTVWVTPSGDSVVDQMLSVRIKAISYMASLRGMDVFDEVYLNTTVGYTGSSSLRVIGEREIWRYPGEVAVFTFELTNTGNGNDSFGIDLFEGAEDWTMEIDSGSGPSGSSANIPLAIGEKTSFEVKVTLPSLSEASTMEELQELRIMAFTEVVNHVESVPSNYPDAMTRVEFTVGVLQEFKTDVYLTSGNGEGNEVLPGREASYSLDLMNAGNGWDNISAMMNGTNRHLRWAFIDSGPYELAPFETSPLNLSVVPIPQDLPEYHETVRITIEAVASDGITYRKATVETRIVMSKVVSDTMQLDLGQEGMMELLLCNMPDPGETPTLNFVMQKSYRIMPELSYGGDRSTGWRVSNSSTEIILTEPYEITTVEVPVFSPSDLELGSEFARVRISVDGGEAKFEQRNMNLRAVFFDVMISEVNSDLYEGEEGTLSIILMASGTRSQQEIPLFVYVGEEMYGPFDAGPANPQEFSTREANPGGRSITYGEQESYREVKVTIPSLKWYEKGMEMDLRVVVDPDDEIIENTVKGSSIAESNNVYREEIQIKNFTPSLPWLTLLAILFLILTIGGTVGYFFLERRDSWFMLPLAAGFAGIFGLLFYIPVEEGGSLGAANGIGLALIVINLLLMIPFFIYMFTKSSDAYVLYLLTARRDKDPPQSTEIVKTPLKPYLVSVLGAFLAAMIPIALWTLPSYIRESGFGGIVEAITDMEAGFPIWSLVILFPLLAAGAQSVMMVMKRGSLNRITGTWDHLERLRSEIEEGFD